MPSNYVVNISIRGVHMDSFTVRVLDSARSHGRALSSITGLLDANADAIYQHLQDQEDASFVIRAGSGQRMMFNRANGQTYHLVLFHVDQTRSQRSQQMLDRYDAL
ncbi:MAG: hypothetical protein K0V04_05570 [Deltaproteobacteria bacterium]|nr:hypothetical protein [Deltaproteobacteria bacterium]